VALLLANKSWVNIPTEAIETALIAAAAAGSAEIVTLLISRRAKIDIYTRGGDTALILAATQGYLDVVKVLVQHGATIDHTKPGYQTTALHRAAQGDHFGVCNYLIRKGADTSELPGTTLESIVSHTQTQDPSNYLTDPFIATCLDPKYREISDERWFSHFEELPEIDSLKKRGEHQNALMLCQKGLEKYPDSFLFYERAAVLYDELGKPDEAERILKEGLLKSLSKCSIAVALADRELEKNNYRNVIRWWITAGVMQLESNVMVEKMPYLNLAYVCQSLGLSEVENWLFNIADTASNEGPIRFNTQGAELRHQVGRAILSTRDDAAQHAIVAFHDRYR
jgi:ankyrin repeat protein